MHRGPGSYDGGFLPRIISRTTTPKPTDSASTEIPAKKAKAATWNVSAHDCPANGNHSRVGGSK